MWNLRERFLTWAMNLSRGNLVLIVPLVATTEPAGGGRDDAITAQHPSLSGLRTQARG